MTRISFYLLTAAFFVGSHGFGRAAATFEKVGVYLEQNIQDEDAEVKFEAIGTSAGLAALKVTAPDGRTVIDFKTPDSKLGIRHLILESPEPKNNGALQADFPEGTYRFAGTTTGGATLQGEAVLTHKMPEPASLVRPRPDEKNVPLSGLQVRWNPVPNAASYVVVIEHEKTGRELRADLSGAAATFAVPDGFLTSGTEYKLAIGTIAKGGNSSFVETTFTTVNRK